MSIVPQFNLSYNVRCTAESLGPEYDRAFAQRILAQAATIVGILDHHVVPEGILTDPRGSQCGRAFAAQTDQAGH